MKNFLREYWLWILIPIVLVLGLVAAALFLGLVDGASPFTYNVI